MPRKSKQRLAVLVGANIAARRKLKGWNQAQFAERLGIGADSLSRMERGLTAPRFSTLEVMAETLDCAVADLFFCGEGQSCAMPLDDAVRESQLSSAIRQEVIFLSERIVQLMRSEA